MLIQNLFPSLFGENGAVSANYLRATVKKSPVNPNCVIIKSDNNKPVEWFMDFLGDKGFTASVIDQFIWRSNTDGSISVFTS